MANLSFTYTSLLAALQAWPTDSDTAYTTNIPTIINLGELRLVRDLNLDIFDTVDATQSTVAGTRAITKPTNAIELRNVGIITATGYKELERRSLTYCKTYAPAPAVQGEPIYFNEDSGTTILLVPTPDAVYVVHQFIKARPTDGLSSVSPGSTSWLSTRVPDALFAACLMESEQYLKADDRYADYKTKYYEELLPVARIELRELIRNGDRAPLRAGPDTQ